MTYRIERDGFFFRAVHIASSTRSQMFTSASQAGLYIQRKAGKDAHRLAFDAFTPKRASAV